LIHKANGLWENALGISDPSLPVAANKLLIVKLLLIVRINNQFFLNTSHSGGHQIITSWLPEMYQVRIPHKSSNSNQHFFKSVQPFSPVLIDM